MIHYLADIVVQPHLLQEKKIWKYGLQSMNMHAKETPLIFKVSQSSCYIWDNRLTWPQNVICLLDFKRVFFHFPAFITFLGTSTDRVAYQWVRKIHYKWASFTLLPFHLNPGGFLLSRLWDKNIWQILFSSFSFQCLFFFLTSEGESA